uniref:Tripartite motif containing 69 n=1 Tax=Microcebus murinus TaxID=30608 RepID=A0A8C5XZZ2_MICMU
MNEEMELNMNKLEEQGLLAKDLLESIQTRMEEQNSFDFLKDIATLLDRLEQGMKILAPREIISRKLNLGQFKGPIQYMKWREMQSTVSPEIRRKIGGFIWEQDQHFLTEKHNEVTPNEIKILRESSELATEHKKELPKRAEKHFIRTPVVEKQMYFPLQNYPVNNMVTGYISIDAMKKFLGELHDFIPGSSGYLAYHVQNEINISAIKNKLKRKY